MPRRAPPRTILHACMPALGSARRCETLSDSWLHATAWLHAAHVGAALTSAHRVCRYLASLTTSLTTFLTSPSHCGSAALRRPLRRLSLCATETVHDTAPRMWRRTWALPPPLAAATSALVPCTRLCHCACLCMCASRAMPVALKGCRPQGPLWTGPCGMRVCAKVRRMAHLRQKGWEMRC